MHTTSILPPLFHYIHHFLHHHHSHDCRNPTRPNNSHPSNTAKYTNITYLQHSLHQQYQKQSLQHHLHYNIRFTITATIFARKRLPPLNSLLPNCSTFRQTQQLPLFSHINTNNQHNNSTCLDLSLLLKRQPPPPLHFPPRRE